MAEKKIRMATSDKPQGHTIVGGRPADENGRRKDIPRGLELLIKKAAVDDDFKKELLQKREKIVDELKAPLDESERAMLACVPQQHLEKMIDATQVPPAQRKALAGASAAAMLALLTQLTFTPVAGRADTPELSTARQGETKSSAQDQFAVLLTGIRPDDDGGEMVKGIRPDNPPPPSFEPAPSEIQETVISESPVLRKSPFDRTVADNYSGMTIAEALQKISDESGIRVEISGLESIEPSLTVAEDSEGETLGRVLEKIFSQIGNTELFFKCFYESDTQTLKVDYFPKLENPAGFAPKPKPEFDDSAICRGIRSDMPEIRKLKDFDDGEQK